LIISPEEDAISYVGRDAAPLKELACGDGAERSFHAKGFDNGYGGGAVVAAVLHGILLAATLLGERCCMVERTQEIKKITSPWARWIVDSLGRVPD
jgi:hypothetical protein